MPFYGFKLEISFKSLREQKKMIDVREKMNNVRQKTEGTRSGWDTEGILKRSISWKS